ncbi:hypothetical protein [Mycolicibacterium arseniciresistens]|uniref:Uncharacterized protein n=1 Tax=Mycolicibacterium arseniciresistens TaxID=3062257 RepID=A0ABT8UBI9_9MYCO|nr:hypothetical protein [Mycolicibacterium arseniciresistens]MDO3634541.1 hypothetical protein [Mycolicibacterium arseniciresistens]
MTDREPLRAACRSATGHLRRIGDAQLPEPLSGAVDSDLGTLLW